MLKKLFGFLAVLLICAVVLSGCSDKNNDLPAAQEEADSTWNYSPKDKFGNDDDWNRYKDAVAALEKDDFEGAISALSSIRDEADCWQMSLYCSARADEAKGWSDSAVNKYGMIPDYLDSGTRKASLSANYYDYSILEDGTLSITAYKGKENIIHVPGEIDGKTVTAIGDGAFRGKRNIKFVTLPSTLVSIGEYAFAESGVGYISIPEGVAEIPAYCFADSRLFEARLPESLTTIGDHAFDTINLHFLKLPENVTSIGSNAISGAYGTETHVYLPASVTCIGEDGVKADVLYHADTPYLTGMYGCVGDWTDVLQHTKLKLIECSVDNRVNGRWYKLNSGITSYIDVTLVDETTPSGMVYAVVNEADSSGSQSNTYLVDSEMVMLSTKTREMTYGGSQLNYMSSSYVR